jgi:hypothetical protein
MGNDQRDMSQPESVIRLLCLDRASVGVRRIDASQWSVGSHREAESDMTLRALMSKPTRPWQRQNRQKTVGVTTRRDGVLAISVQYHELRQLGYLSQTDSLERLTAFRREWSGSQSRFVLIARGSCPLQ